jgi:transposase InsO family protein
MEEQWQVDRAMLRRLLQTEPTWTERQYAAAIGRSIGWVSKWKRRLRQAAPTDTAVLVSRSRARKTPVPRVDPRIVERILEIRDRPPERLHRVPGPKAILYYLAQEEPPQGLSWPRAACTIWRSLRTHGRIAPRPTPQHSPQPRPAPLEEWQWDFKDVSTVPPDPEGKHKHVVETLNAVDVGTSVVLSAQVRPDFTAETAVLALVEVLQTYGLPTGITIDRDPRFVGSPQQRDFPAPFVRFWLNLGVTVHICPPHHPQDNAFVERYHRTYEYECLRIHKPTDVAHAREVTADFVTYYNMERPHQGLSCANRPPRVAYPALPPRPSVPLIIDPDRWVSLLDGHCYSRKVQHDTSVSVDGYPYYLTADLVGQVVVLRIAAATREFVVEHHGQEYKRLTIKGLCHRLLTFDDYVAYMAQEARAERFRHPVWGRQLPLGYA